jgi:hypothetical protein
MGLLGTVPVLHAFDTIRIWFLQKSILKNFMLVYRYRVPFMVNVLISVPYVPSISNIKLLAVAAGLSNRPVARSHIAVGAMGLPPLHVVCGGVGQLWIPRT